MLRANNGKYRDRARRVKSKYIKQLPPVLDKDDPVAYAARYLKIQDKDKNLVPLFYNPPQIHFLKNRTGRDLILKARQLGFSTAIEADYFREAVTSTQTVGILAHDRETTQKLRRIVERFYKNMPDDVRPVRKYANASLATYPQTDSEYVIATAGSKNVGRGGTYSRIHGSEVAFWKDAETIVAGFLQGGNPDIVLESTANGAQGYFYELCKEALDGNSNWTLHFYPWWDEPTYRRPVVEPLEFTAEEIALMAQHNLTAEQIAWRRYKQRELKHLFLQEYPEDPLTCFLLSGLGYFGDISAALTALLNPLYHQDHVYVAGLDFGQANDFTALSIADVTARQEVSRLRINRLPWSEMRRQIASRCQAWGVSVLVAEANSMGTTNIEELHKELEARKIETVVVPFWTTNDSKTSIAANLYETLHSADGLKLQNDLDDPAWTRELNAFVAKQLPSMVWRLEAADNEHDDTVIARMLVWYGVLNCMRQVLAFANDTPTFTPTLEIEGRTVEVEIDSDRDFYGGLR